MGWLAARHAIVACLALITLVVVAAADNGNPNPVVFGPKTFVRANGKPNQYTAQFNVPSWIIGPFAMHVVNGDDNGRERVTAGTVSLNGTQIVGPSDLNPNVATLDRTVTPGTSNVLQVTLDGLSLIHI